MSFSSDWLFPPFQSRAMVEALMACDRQVSYSEITTAAGHDAFLLEDSLDRYGELIRGFVRNLEPTRVRSSRAAVEACHRPASIYQDRRLDYDTIQNLIPPQATVLDLGCGTGGLLTRLRDNDHSRLAGVEWDEYALPVCVKQGLDVIQHDLNAGLAMFRDHQFDVVVLSQTLQSVTNVQQIIREMLRVGKQCIVSFPNAAFDPLRRRMAEDGLAPVPGSFAVDGQHKWYDTPHTRFCSIADFDAFCNEKNICVHKAVYLDTARGRTIVDDPNRHADTAIYVLCK